VDNNVVSSKEKATNILLEGTVMRVNRVVLLFLIVAFVVGFFGVVSPAYAKGPDKMVQVCTKVLPPHHETVVKPPKPEPEPKWVVVPVPKVLLAWYLKQNPEAFEITPANPCPPPPKPPVPPYVPPKQYSYSIRVIGVPAGTDWVSWTETCANELVKTGGAVVWSPVKVEMMPGAPDVGKRVADLGSWQTMPTLKCFRANIPPGAEKTIINTGIVLPN
jgi:hypothetical protein